MTEDGEPIVQCTIDFDGVGQILTYILERDKENKPFIMMCEDCRTKKRVGKFPLDSELLEEQMEGDLEYLYLATIHVSRNPR